eukprot:scaffold230759_cov32-Tisochrysis_lutea.AAC.2
MTAHARTEHTPPPTKSASGGGSRARMSTDASKISQKKPITAAVRKHAEPTPMKRDWGPQATPSCCRVLISSNGASRQPRIAPPHAPEAKARRRGAPSMMWRLLMVRKAVLYPANGTVRSTIEAAVAGSTPR